MSLDADILKFGAKAANLDYIHNSLPDVPIEPYIMVPVGADWRDYEKEIYRLGDCIVRSTSPFEDGKKASFAGLLDSKIFKGQQTIDTVKASCNNPLTLEYAKIHGIKTPIETGLLFHRYFRDEMNFSMLRHPHQENLFLIMGRASHADMSENYIYDENLGKIQELDNWYNSFEYPGLADHEDAPEEIALAIEIYKRIESLQRFQDNHSYNMEFGTYPHSRKPVSIYQFRPFREKQKSSWNIDTLDIEKQFPEDKYHIIYSPLCFGITPKEGLDLNLARAMTYKGSEAESLFKRYRELSGKSRQYIVDELLKLNELSPHENIYAEEIAGYDTKSNDCGYIFDNAISNLNAKAGKDRTCIWQENIHEYTCKPIDIVFPNAKVWLAENGMEFLSHDAFRAAQHYDIAAFLHSYGSKSIDGRTGDNIRIISDGRMMAAIEKRI